MKTQLPFLELLSSSSKAQRLHLIGSMSGKQLKAFSEVFVNIRYGYIPVSDAIKNKLHKKRDIICQLTTKSITQKRRKVLIEQEVHLLITTLKAVLPFLKSKV